MIEKLTEKMKRTEELALPEPENSEPSESIADLTRRILRMIGEDPEREGLRHTPERFEKALRFLTSGYHQDQDKVLNGAMFSVTYDQMVLVKDIEVHSLCEHHMLPFFGHANIAYIPDGKIIGLSKLARITDMFARRMQVQERLTVQIADAVQTILQPKGVAVVIEAKHLCMMARGVEKKSSDMVTSHVLGLFRNDRATRAEFMNLIGKQRS